MVSINRVGLPDPRTVDKGVRWVCAMGILALQPVLLAAFGEQLDAEDSLAYPRRGARFAQQRQAVIVAGGDVHYKSVSHRTKQVLYYEHPKNAYNIPISSYHFFVRYRYETPTIV